MGKRVTMRPRKIALLLIVLGAVCLPAPAYLGWAAETTAPPAQTSQIYHAEPVDPANESDRKQIVDRRGTTVALSIHQVSERYSAGEYRAPNETHQTLEAAMESGSATTEDADAQADLSAIARNYTFVHDAYGDREQYYRLTVEDDGGVVRADPVSIDRVANVTVEEGAVQYGDLSTGEQETVDRIIDSADDSGYRPRVDEPFVDRLPALVEKDGTVYSLHVSGHVDDFGPGFSGFVVGLLVAGVGVVLLLAGAGTYAVVWLRERSAD
jgi:hypothetical protein